MIIGITGTFAAGKGTIVKYLEEQGFQHYSARKYLSNLLKKDNIEVNRDNLIKLANQLREDYGPEYLAKELYNTAKKECKNAVIESLRCVGEIKYLQKLDDFLCIAIDADQRIRYERAIARDSETDHITFEKFKLQEQVETNTEDDFKANLQDCIKVADICFINNDSKEQLLEQLESNLKLLIS